MLLRTRIDKGIFSLTYRPKRFFESYKKDLGSLERQISENMTEENSAGYAHEIPKCTAFSSLEEAKVLQSLIGEERDSDIDSWQNFNRKELQSLLNSACE